MRIEDVSNLEALAFVLLLAILALAVYHLLPSSGQEKSSPDDVFETSEITGYDRALPKHFIAAFSALAIGGAHAGVKNIPSLGHWLADGGYGGHLVRDIANSHLIIVVGGTIAAAGLTWYVLPRITKRPLFSEGLATASFLCTLVGALGFYATNIVAGLVLAQHFHASGVEADLDAWRAIPLGLSATIMGLGYWTFVANVLATIWLSRRVAGDKRDGHLAKYFLVGAMGLFIGTVQGVIQVMPGNEDWLHRAGAAGEYIDPIAHAHVNLVTGILMLVGGLCFYFYRSRAQRTSRTFESAIFWSLTLSSVGFYLTFMALGFAEGSLITNEGLTFEQAVDRLGMLHSVPLLTTGIAVLISTWVLIGAIASRFYQARLLGSARLFVVAACMMLFIGTSQGLLQAVPAVKEWLESAGQAGDGVANVHAQLNMLGGVIPALVGLSLIAGPVCLLGVVGERLVRSALLWLVSGVAVYYGASLYTAIATGEAVRSGQPEALARVGLGPVPFLVAAAGAVMFARAFSHLTLFIWSTSSNYRKQAWRQVRRALAEYESGSGPARPIRPRCLAIEGCFGLFGFPGIGWIMAGRPLIGVPLALIGPGIAWAALPALATGEDALMGKGLAIIGIYLLASTGLATTGLASLFIIRRKKPEGAAAHERSLDGVTAG